MLPQQYYAKIFNKYITVDSFDLQHIRIHYNQL